MDSKIKTGPLETTLRKSSSPGSLGVPKLSRIMTKSEPNSPANRSRKAPTPPEKTRTRIVIGTSESSQVQLKDDLRKANELIASLENDKASLYEKLYEALQDQKMAEFENFKAAEAGVEAFHRKEEELKKELEAVKNQHASDSALLLLVTRELEKASQELAASNDAKNMLLSQAENASKNVAMHAKNATISSNEIAVLKSELEKARSEVKRRDKIIERLDGEMEVLKMDESQWCNKAIALERELEEANKRVHAVESGAKLMAKVGFRQSEELEKLKAELETVKEENDKVWSELETSKEEEEKIEIALHQASSEARELKEKLLSLGGKDYETKLGHYKEMLDEAWREIDVLVAEVEQAKMREAGLVGHVKKCDEEMSRLGGLVKRSKEEADGALKKECEMRDELKEVEDEVSYLQETLREARAESLKLNAKMLDKESEFQSVVHENDLLRVKQCDSMMKIKELEEALGKKHALSDSEQDYDLVETHVKLEENREEKEDSTDGNNDDDDDDAVEVEYSMWESYHTGKKEAFHKGK